MSVAELNERYACSGIREIDEYLNGTICEILPDEEDLDDIAAPDEDDFDVDMTAEPEEIDDEYVGNSRRYQ